MRVFFSVRYASPVGMALAVLAGCSTGVPPATAPPSGVGPGPFAVMRGLPAPPGTSSQRHSRVRPDLTACTTVTARTGTMYTVANVGGTVLDVEWSAYAGCTIGVYFPPSTQNQGLANNAMINGPFGIGVYVDTVTGHFSQGALSICVNGSTTAGTCKTGSLTSSGTGELFWNTPVINGDHTAISGYVAGFATNPCPNPNNNITLDHTVITGATYPWSYLGGNNNLNFGAGHNSPNNPIPNCQGSGVGAGGSNIYVADYNNNAAKQMVAATSYSTINILGSGFTEPFGIALDASNDVFIADYGNSAVKEILASSGYSTVNTLGSGFRNPLGVAVDTAGNVFVADTFNSAIKELVAPGYTTIKTIGSGFSYPFGVAVDSVNNLYVADTYHNAIKEILGPGYTTINTLVSYPTVSVPYSLAVDGSGNLYVADVGYDRIDQILAAGGYTSVKTLGSGFNYPYDVALDTSNNVYVADTLNNAIKEIMAPAYTTIATLGSGFNGPTGVAILNPLAIRLKRTTGHKPRKLAGAIR
jgi:hypothetical protein